MIRVSGRTRISSSFLVWISTRSAPRALRRLSCARSRTTCARSGRPRRSASSKPRIASWSTAWSSRRCCGSRRRRFARATTLGWRQSSRGISSTSASARSSVINAPPRRPPRMKETRHAFPCAGSSLRVAEAAIEIEGLTKRFDGVPAVDGVSFRVPRGAVYGFLGPNGSGKTTTLGMLTGLIPPDAGRARIAGREVTQDAPAALASVGALVEEPAFYPALTGRRNLRLLASLGGGDEAAVTRALATVGLAQAADQRYKG